MRKRLFFIFLFLWLIFNFSTAKAENFPVNFFCERLEEGGYLYAYPEAISKIYIDEDALVINLDTDNYSGGAIGVSPSVDLGQIRYKGAIEFLIKGENGGEKGQISLLDSDGMDSQKVEVSLELSPFVQLTPNWQFVSISLGSFSDMGKFWDGTKSQVAQFDWFDVREIRFQVSPKENKEFKIYVRDLKITTQPRETKEAQKIKALYFKPSQVIKTDTQTNTCYAGVFRPFVPKKMENLEDYELLTGKKPAFIVFYIDWASEFPAEDCQKLWEAGYLPLITWEPWFWADREKIHLDNIINGEWDEYIKSWAESIKKWGKPLMLRWAHEFNGNWYPWSIAQNKKDPYRYIKAYRHIYKLVKETGVDNVQWIWSPYAQSIPYERWNDYLVAYPGDEYVDWIGMDGYNWGMLKEWSSPQSFEDIFFDIYYRLSHRLPDKPIMIAEFASAQIGVKKDKWVKEMDVALKGKFDRIKAIAWFDMAKEADWRVASSAKSLKAYQKVIRKPYYLTSNTGLWTTKDWFNKETKNLPLPQRPEKETAKIIKFKTPPVIDGNLTEWNKAYYIFLGVKEDIKLGNTWKDADDLSAKIYLGWDEDNLYVAAEIKDDAPFTNSNANADIWNGDCLEIALATNPEVDPKRVFFNSGDYQMGLSPGNGKEIGPSVWIWQHAQPPSNIEIKTNRLPDDPGYIIEAKVAFSNFNSFKPQKKEIIGFNAAVDDADLAEEREVQMVWSGSQNFYRDPSQWGIAVFAGLPEVITPIVVILIGAAILFIIAFIVLIFNKLKR